MQKWTNKYDFKKTLETCVADLVVANPRDQQFGGHQCKRIESCSSASHKCEQLVSMTTGRVRKVADGFS